MKKTFFIIAITIFFVLYLFSNFSGEGVVKEFRISHSSSVFDPLEFFSLALVVTSFILLFFNSSIFNLWRIKFMNWFIVLALMLIISGSDSFSYAWPTHTSWAIILGSIMVIVTLVFSLVQRFYYKTV